MPSQTIETAQYHGSLQAVALLQAGQTVLLSDLGSETAGTLVDDTGVLSGYDDGLSTFDGAPVTYLGSGTATPGAEALGGSVALGPAVPVVVFEAADQVHFHFPQAKPDPAGAVLLTLDLEPAAAKVFTPVCFASGTAIRTPNGDMPVEMIQPGDRVLDWFDQEHEVLWCRGKRLRLPNAADYDKWRPVRIAAGAFGAGKPHVDTWVSQQHRIYLEGLRVTLFCGEKAALAPAKLLINGHTVSLDRERREVEYWHILCRTHVILAANGMPAESLLTVADPANAEHREIFSELRHLFGEDASPMQMAVSEVTPQAARVLAGLRAY